jgi:uncharacterized protein DUF4386
LAFVPALARRYDDPAASEATQEATTVVFESFHRYLGIAIGECLGYLFTGAWTLLVSIAMLQSSAFEAWLALPGIAIGLLLVAGSLEFVGRFGEGLETCGRDRANRLHRLVALAGDIRARASVRLRRGSVLLGTARTGGQSRGPVSGNVP